MEIELRAITIRELVEGYLDRGEEGVTGFGGRLDIRPPYQREFIYKEKQRDAVISTINKSFPLNTMYWAVREDGGFEIIDGQQRTISICQYVTDVFPHEFRYFHNLNPDEQEHFLDYVLMIYFCNGTASEKLDWFRTINIAGEKLTEQELRNVTYAGSWLSDAKRYFSRTNCVASQIAGDYITGSPIRQDYLEAAIDWISGGNVENYMAEHQHDQNASALWRYFQSVITWVTTTFVVKRKGMKGVNWGFLYNNYGDKLLDTKLIEEATRQLILDDDVTKKSGIYPFLLTGDEKYLSIRGFTDAMKAMAYERQNGICPVCGNHFEPEEMEADHITPWKEGGKTNSDNLQMLCREDNRRKSGK